MEGSNKTLSKGPNPSPELAVSLCQLPFCPSPGLQFYSRTAFSEVGFVYFSKC